MQLSGISYLLHVCMRWIPPRTSNKVLSWTWFNFCYLADRSSLRLTIFSAVFFFSIAAAVLYRSAISRCHILQVSSSWLSCSTYLFFYNGVTLPGFHPRCSHSNLINIAELTMVLSGCTSHLLLWQFQLSCRLSYETFLLQTSPSTPDQSWFLITLGVAQFFLLISSLPRQYGHFGCPISRQTLRLCSRLMYFMHILRLSHFTSGTSAVYYLLSMNLIP